MSQSSKIEFLIDFAWACGADCSLVNLAKEELKKLSAQYDLIAWARINSKGIIYDPRLCYNPYLDENTVIPLYINRQVFEEKYGKLSK